MLVESSGWMETEDSWKIACTESAIGDWFLDCLLQELLRNSASLYVSIGWDILITNVLII